MSASEKKMKRMITMVRTFGAISAVGIATNSYMVFHGFMAIV